jgi:segregation and condensation protein A
MAEKMADIDEETRKRYTRGYNEEDTVEKQATGEALKDVTLFDLISAFKKVLTDIERKNIVHHIEKVETTVEEREEFVLIALQNAGKQSFRELCAEVTNRIVLVVTFLAILEMIKEQQINLFLEEDPTEFYIDLKPVDEIIRA